MNRISGADPGTIRSRIPLQIFTTLLVLFAVGLWGATRLPALERFPDRDRPYTFNAFPALLSASFGPPARQVGLQVPLQAWEFQHRGGMIPSSDLDVRKLPARGDVKSITKNDPGVCRIWFVLSRAGMPLSAAGIARVQVGADFVALLLAIGLAWRLAGPLAGSLAGVSFGSSEIVTESRGLFCPVAASALVVLSRRFRRVEKL